MKKIFKTYQELKNAFHETHLDDEEFEIDPEEWIEYKFNNNNYYVTIENYNTYKNKTSKKVSNEELDFTILIEHYFDDVIDDYERQITLPPLLDPFKTAYKSYRGINYTPDFLLKIGKREILIEVKGFLRNDDGFKYKIYDYFINHNNYAIWGTRYEYYVVILRGKEREGQKMAYLNNQNLSWKAKNKKKKNNFRTLVLEKGN